MKDGVKLEIQPWGMMLLFESREAVEKTLRAIYLSIEQAVQSKAPYVFCFLPQDNLTKSDREEMAKLALANGAERVFPFFI